jgi:hypothetical protein
MIVDSFFTLWSAGFHMSTFADLSLSNFEKFDRVGSRDLLKSKTGS